MPEYARFHIVSKSPSSQSWYTLSLTANKHSISDDHVRAPASAPDVRSPRLLQGRAVHPEKHRAHAKEEVHGHHGKPKKYSGPAIDTVSNLKKGDGKRGLAPGLAADG